jgi:hypothetical protein
LRHKGRLLFFLRSQQLAVDLDAQTKLRVPHYFWLVDLEVEPRITKLLVLGEVGFRAKVILVVAQQTLILAAVVAAQALLERADLLVMVVMGHLVLLLVRRLIMLVVAVDGDVAPPLQLGALVAVNREDWMRQGVQAARPILEQGEQGEH